MDDIIGFSLSDKLPEREYNNELILIKENLENLINKKILAIQKKHRIIVFIHQNLEEYDKRPLKIRFSIDLNNSKF